MSYSTGGVTDWNDLLNVLLQTAQQKGWELNNGVLSKGRAFVRPYVRDKQWHQFNDIVFGAGLLLQAGTGVDAHGALTEVCLVEPRLGAPDKDDSILGVRFPARYHIFAFENPDEIYLILNFGVTNYYSVAFGISTIPGLPGSGFWMAGSAGNNSGRNYY